MGAARESGPVAATVEDSDGERTRLLGHGTASSGDSGAPRAGSPASSWLPPDAAPLSPVVRRPRRRSSAPRGSSGGCATLSGDGDAGAVPDATAAAQLRGSTSGGGASGGRAHGRRDLGAAAAAIASAAAANVAALSDGRLQQWRSSSGGGPAADDVDNDRAAGRSPWGGARGRGGPGEASQEGLDLAAIGGLGGLGPLRCRPALGCAAALAGSPRLPPPDARLCTPARAGLALALLALSLLGLGYLTPERLHALVLVMRSHPAASLVVYSLVFVASVILMLPGMLFSIAAGAAFGFLLGAAVAFLATVIGEPPGL
jgi:hypothetical protein